MELTPDQLETMVNVTTFIRGGTYVYIGIYTILTIIDLIKSYKSTIARVMSNGIFLLMNLLIVVIFYQSWKFLSHIFWIPTVLTIAGVIGMIVLGGSAIDERTSTTGGNNDNGCFNIFNSIIKHRKNVKDYKDNISRLKTKHKFQIQ
jgi:hypothetical protein